MKHIIYFKYIFSAAIFIFLTFAQLAAQGIEARISADTNEMLIGDQINLTLSVSHTPNVKVEWPLFVDTLAGFDIISKTQVESANADNKILEYQQITLTAFDSGFYRIPSIDIPYTVDGSADPKATFTNAVSINVFTVPIDTTQDIKAIKEIIGEPLTFGDYLPYIILGLLLVGLIGGGIWYFSRRNKEEPLVISRPQPKIPPHEIAMKKLADLEAERLWQKGEIKAYYIGLTEILREYMEGRFNIAALESTTHEIMRDLGGMDLKPIQMTHIGELLEMADLAKFAKFKPGQNENLLSMDTVRTFIKETKSWKEKSEGEENNNNSNSNEEEKISETISDSK